MSKAGRFYLFTSIGLICSALISILLFGGYRDFPNDAFIKMRVTINMFIEVEVFMFLFTTFLWRISLLVVKPNGESKSPLVVDYGRLRKIFLGGFVIAVFVSIIQTTLIGSLAQKYGDVKSASDFLIYAIGLNLIYAFVLSIVVWRVSLHIYPLYKHQDKEQ